MPGGTGWHAARIAFQRKKMIHFDLNTMIYRPLTQVFAFVASPENDFQWQYGTLSTVHISLGEIGMGTLFRAVGHMLGRRIDASYEITVFEQNRSYGFKSVSGPVDSNTLYTFEMLNGGTRIAFSMQTDPKDAFQPGGAIVVRKFRKQYKENLAMLKSILEAHQTVRVGMGTTPRPGQHI
jgi:hypothetical protein